MNPIFLSWGIGLAATAGVILRPFRWPEAIWAVSGALLLVALGLVPVNLAWQAVGKGTDVYLFLIGMMLLSELGRREGLFDWIAVLAVNYAKGSPRKLFLLVYLVGVVVTTFLSNDAAAVVLTPAVFAAAKKADTKPLPLSVRVRVHRQRGELRVADIESRQSRALRESHACAGLCG